MSANRLGRVTRIGRRVDPIILAGLGKGSAREFRSSLSYHFKAGGKRMRAAIVVLSCAAAGGTMTEALRPASVVEMIHNYSLVMDDLIDRGELRRGKPTVRVLLGDSVALLVAMFYREVLDDLVQGCVARDKVRETAVRVMKEIIEGERLDLLFEQSGRQDPYLISHRVSVPNFTLYLDMIGKKTASLFEAAAEIGGYAAGGDVETVKALSGFGWKAGLAFQIMDDVLDICGKTTGKLQAKDVIEHKLGNAAILVAIKFLPKSGKSELASILASERVSPRMKSRARALVMSTPAETVCREIGLKYLQDAKNHLNSLKDSVYKEDLALLADQIVTRSF